MGSADTITKEYMRDNAVFADAFNYLIYDGRHVVMPENLRELDTTEIALPFHPEHIHNGDSHDAVQKYRDILKSAVIKKDDTAAYVLLGVENQTDVHYAMPVRNIIYDALQYGRQVSDIAAFNRKNAPISEKHSRGEYLSGFYRNDYIVPVITLVVHFGADKWDGPLSLYDMMKLDDPDLMRFVQDYRIHLIDPAAVTKADLLKFSTSLREVIGCIKYSGNGDEFRNFITDNPRMTMEINAARVISVITKASFNDNNDSEVIDMCRAIEDLIAEGKAEVRAEMSRTMADKIAESEAQGRISAFADLVRNGILTVSEASDYIGMSADDFKAAISKL